ncbi:MAG: biotin carboxylase N-terminal domain-containing protein [Paracoccaceae bacterium]
MFDTILIANRGEIACRVIETAQAMGVRCVAVFSDVDAGSKHVQMANEAVHIGGAAPKDSYLRGDVIVEAALDRGAQAIHPGYGFLSENPEFVELIQAAGLVFIGPDADAIRAMGLKDAAKVVMEKAGVPVVPGYHGADQTKLPARAEEIGYPVLIKAVAGGGGKGMRLVEEPADFEDALKSAQSEALTAFGNDTVLIEKYVSKPRHIEVQVFGDGKRAVHLFERDCSLQRRHQKVIEEAPAPGMTQEMRDEMGGAAVRAAAAIGYKGAGTVEFIVDASEGLRSDRFYFMEMNTRLQVEHPVTEAITGVDLVEWQLRVAAGEALPKEQGQLALNGHAFEARLYAEDVPAGFLPSTGTLQHLQFPATARADSGVRAGDAISPFYDPMIAKVITFGPTRAVALARLRKALSQTEVAGTVTNLAFLGALASHKEFVAGDVDTGLIARDIDDLTAPIVPEPQHAVAAAMAVAGVERNQPEAGFTLWEPLARTITLSRNGEEFEVVMRAEGPDRQRWAVAGADIFAERVAGQWQIDGQVAPQVHLGTDTVTVFDAYGITYRIVDPLDRAAAAQGNGNIIEAPMPGLVKAVFARAGENVVKGDRLAVLEAMKMEHALLAERDGVVADVLVIEGEQIEAGAALVKLKEEG